MSNIDILSVGLFIGYFGYPLIYVGKKIIRNAYAEYRKRGDES